VHRGHRRREPGRDLRPGRPRPRLRGADRRALLLPRHRGVRPLRPRRARRAVERPARRRPLEHPIAAALEAGRGRGVLITGGAGQLGTALAELYPEALSVDLAEWDISLPAPPLIAEREWELVIHGAAWTNVDGAEDDPQGAAAIN